MSFSTIVLTVKSEADKDFMMNLYEEYYFIMRRRAMIIVKNESIVDDIVHVAIIKFIIHMDTIRNLEKHILLAYIITTVKRISYNYLSSKYIRDCLYTSEIKDNYFENLEDKSVSIEEYVMMKIRVEELEIVLTKLPQKYQKVLKFKYLLYMDDREI
jgi:hypothetical protein